MINIIDDEVDNAFLRRKKKSVRNKFKPTQSKTIEEANLLCVWLIALGRSEHAREMLKSYATEIPFDQHRWQRWEATCKAILLLSYLEQLNGNLKESSRLNKIVLEQDYHSGSTSEEMRSWFWQNVEGFNSVPGLIETCELKQNDICAIYGEHLQEFIYFQQLSSSIEGFTEADRLVLSAVLQENLDTLKECVLSGRQR